MNYSGLKAGDRVVPEMCVERRSIMALLVPVLLLGLSTVCVGASFVQVKPPSLAGFALVAETQFVLVFRDAVPISNDAIKPQFEFPFHHGFEPLGILDRVDEVSVVETNPARFPRHNPVVLNENLGVVAARVVGDLWKAIFRREKFTTDETIRHSGGRLPPIYGLKNSFKPIGEGSLNKQPSAFPVYEGSGAPSRRFCRFLGNGALPLHFANLPFHLAALVLDGDPSQSREYRVYCRDVYDDPFGALPRQGQLLVAFLFAVSGWSLMIFVANKDRVSWWHIPLFLLGAALFFMSVGLLLLGHAWPPN